MMLGVSVQKKIETVHLDKIALEGMKLTSFYSQPVCGPARAALLTGCYPDRVNRGGWNVGRIIDLLKKLHLDNNTFVLFTSDNGPWLSKGEMGGSAFPLRGGKGSSWEGGYRVPCILWGPKRIPAGVVSNELMATLDILPTFAALAGGEVPTDRVIDGLDQSNFITGRTKVSERDISEKQNLADKHPEIVRQLIILSEQARQDIGDVDITGKNKRRSP